jgi:hypothetical protein
MEIFTKNSAKCTIFQSTICNKFSSLMLHILKESEWQFCWKPVAVPTLPQEEVNHLKDPPKPELPKNPRSMRRRSLGSSASQNSQKSWDKLEELQARHKPLKPLASKKHETGNNRHTRVDERAYSYWLPNHDLHLCINPKAATSYHTRRIAILEESTHCC